MVLGVRFRRIQLCLSDNLLLLPVSFTLYLYHSCWRCRWLFYKTSRVVQWAQDPLNLLRSPTWCRLELHTSLLTSWLQWPRHHFKLPLYLQISILYYRGQAVFAVFKFFSSSVYYWKPSDLHFHSRSYSSFNTRCSYLLSRSWHHQWINFKNNILIHRECWRQLFN